MMRFVAMIVMTLRRLARSRMLFVAVGGAVLTMLQFGLTLSMVQHAQKSGVPKPSGDMINGFFANALGMLNLFSSLIALFSASFVIRRDLSDGTAASVLSKPVSRGEYVAANALGGVAFLAAVWVLFGSVMLLAMVVLGTPPGWVHIGAIAGRFLSVLPLFALAMMFSLWVNAWVGGFLALVVVQTPAIIGGVYAVLGQLGVHVPGFVVDALVLPFPVVGSLDGLTNRLHSSALAGPSIRVGILHVIDYAAVMVLIAWVVFRRLEVNRMRD